MEAARPAPGERRLPAVLAADVARYSRLIGAAGSSLFIPLIANAAGDKPGVPAAGSMDTAMH